MLESGENDHVFINFVDHGGVGLIGFPTEYLYAKDLMAALTTMNEKKMYKELVFYMEACESGSMFEGTANLTFISLYHLVSFSLLSLSITLSFFSLSLTLFSFSLLSLSITLFLSSSYHFVFPSSLSNCACAVSFSLFFGRNPS